MKLLYFIISIFTIVNLSFAQCDYDIGDINEDGDLNVLVVIILVNLIIVSRLMNWKLFFKSGNLNV